MALQFSLSVTMRNQRISKGIVSRNAKVLFQLQRLMRHKNHQLIYHVVSYFWGGYCPPTNSQSWNGGTSESKNADGCRLGGSPCCFPLLSQPVYLKRSSKNPAASLPGSPASRISLSSRHCSAETGWSALAGR